LLKVILEEKLEEKLPPILPPFWQKFKILAPHDLLFETFPSVIRKATISGMVVLPEPKTPNELEVFSTEPDPTNSKLQRSLNVILYSFLKLQHDYSK
jgi:hypothetical protein